MSQQMSPRETEDHSHLQVYLPGPGSPPERGHAGLQPNLPARVRPARVGRVLSVRTVPAGPWTAGLGGPGSPNYTLTFFRAGTMAFPLCVPETSRGVSTLWVGGWVGGWMKDAAIPSSCTLDHTSNAFWTGSCGRPPSVAVRQARVVLPPTRSSLGNPSQWLVPSPGVHTRLYLGQTWDRETQQAGGRAWRGQRGDGAPATCWTGL